MLSQHYAAPRARDELLCLQGLQPTLAMLPCLVLHSLGCM